MERQTQVSGRKTGRPSDCVCVWVYTLQPDKGDYQDWLVGECERPGELGTSAVFSLHVFLPEWDCLQDGLAPWVCTRS